MKKALSLILALTLCLTLAVPAMAADHVLDDQRPFSLSLDREPVDTQGDRYLQEFTVAPDAVFTVTHKADSTLLLLRVYFIVENVSYYLNPGTGAFDLKGDGFSYEEHNIAKGASVSFKLPFELAGKEQPSLQLRLDIWTRADGFPYQTYQPYRIYPAAPVTQPSTSSEAPAETPAAKPAIVLSPQKLSVDGNSRAPEMYNIGGTNFFGLRALRPYLGYEVDFDGGTNTAIVTTK